MKTTTKIGLGAITLVLAACGQASGPAAEGASPLPAQTGAGTSTGMQAGMTGEARGTIVSIGSKGDFLAIDHGPIEGVGMGAMTMGFDTLSDVDLSGFAEGDEVAFSVEMNRDGSLRVTAVCSIAKQSEDCLSSAAWE